MSPEENAPSTNIPNPMSSGHLVPAEPPGVPQPQSPEWLSAAGYTEQPMAGGGGFSRYLHALRRRWLLVGVAGLVCGTIAGIAVFLTHVPMYTSGSLLRVASDQEKILFNTADRFTDFDIYKGSQIQYLKSRFVLIAAIRKSEIAKLPTIEQEDDPVVWLAEHVQVGFPGNAEIMQVSLRGKNPEEVAALVNGVVDAYMTEVVDVERNERRQRLSDLDKIYAEKETELRDKRTDLKVLAEQLGTGDSEALNLKQKLILERFAALRTQHSGVQFQVMRSAGALKVAQNSLQRAEKQPVSEAELDAAAQAEPQVVELLARRDQVKALLTHSERTASSRVAARYVQQYQQDLKQLDEQVTTEREKLRELLQAKKQASLRDSVSQLQFEMEILVSQEEQLAADVEKSRLEAEKCGVRSIDMEMLRAEITLLDDLLNKIADERQKLIIELRSRPRVTVLQKAAIPQSPDRSKRAEFTAVASMAGFMLPCLLIVWLDTRGRRVNTSAEVVHDAGLEVIGAVPIIPARAASDMSGKSRRYQHWRDVLAESVDAVTARLLRKAEIEKMRVVLVSSAVGGEGKTTVATQLALSLARTGHRTVLVDFDLRRPAVDQVLGLPLEPGVSEMLRKEAQLSDVIQHTAGPNLCVVAAGRWHRSGVAALANGVAGKFFAQLRQEFEFVVVDASPVLPVVDARFLSRYVDGVVLAVLRDVSRIPKILATCEILSAFGVRILGAVVTGAPDEMYYSSERYEPVTS